MQQPFDERILQGIEQAAGLYHRLLLVVASAGAGKTSALQNVQERTTAPLINVNLELSRQMLDLTEKQRRLKVPQLLEEILTRFGGEVVLLDNIEILFDISLKQDPLRLLQKISRNRTVVAAWNGSVEDDSLIYATPDHPEYRRYPTKDLLLVTHDAVV